MKTLWFMILVLLLCSCTENTSANFEATIFPFAIFTRLLPIGEHTINLYKLWNAFLKDPSKRPTSISFSNEEQNMIEHMLTISSKIADLEHQIKETSDLTIPKILHEFPKAVKLELNMHELKLIVNQINFAEEQMRNYLILGYNKIRKTTSPVVPNQSSSRSVTNDRNATIVISNSTTLSSADVDMRIERYTLENFATWATDHSFNSLMSLLRRLHDLIVPSDDDGLFNLVLQVSKDVSHSTCNLKQSLHQTLYNLYNSITIAELKGNTILQFSYMILQMNNKGNFTEEAKISMQNYQNHSKQKIEVVRKALSTADRTIYKCDPKQYVEGVTHTKLTRLLQGYIENEVNLNPYGTCRENCQYYTYTEYNGCYKNQFCANQEQCRGKVVNCRYVDSDMHICTSRNPERRYDWVEYENGKILGNKGVCEKKNFFSVDSWWRYLFWHCSYCLCLCDDVNQGSDRYFNLRKVTSDIEENKVVTGVRIVKKNKIIHLQIQQGVLTPFGVINRTSLNWKPVDNYTIDDDNVENNVDYYTMSWLERAVDTDEVSGPSEHVVTGLRLRKIGTHLNLEVRVTPINFTSGEVYKDDNSLWLGNDNTDASLNHPRTEIVLDEPDIPTRRGPHTSISKHDQYIQFQPTSFESDAGQTTVPFFDSQALTSRGFPLSGIGLIHRGKRNSGGFIAPKLISYDFTPHLGLNKTD